MKTPPKRNLTIALSPEQHARVKARCQREREPMSVLLPKVLDRWASEVVGLEGRVEIRRAKPATYRK